MTPPRPVLEIAAAAKSASVSLRTATSTQRNTLLHRIADALVANAESIVEANAHDVENGRANGMTPGLLDRLTLTPERLDGIADAVREVAALPDPVGQVVRGSTLPNGLLLRQVRVPMGVVGMIYEARPNVTVDAAVLALKSGNAVVLRGGSAAASSNTEIVRVMGQTLVEAGFPAELVQSIDAYGREGAVELMHARGYVDVLVPRGGADLIQTVVREATVPVIETGVGNCHIYVDASADPQMARDIVLNAKTQRVGVCNATETLLVHREAADQILPRIARALAAAEVTLHASDAARAVIADAAPTVPATDEDWDTEYLSLDIAVEIVEDIVDAITHINTHGSGHTDAIVTSDVLAAQRFQSEVDSAAVIVNASTRFTDGGLFGLGAEIGISTQKLHARGPMGLTDLTTTTWHVNGTGQVRDGWTGPSSCDGL